jgi:hypothetical protein
LPGQRFPANPGDPLDEIEELFAGQAVKYPSDPLQDENED